MTSHQLIKLPPLDFGNVIAHFKPYAVPVLWRDGSCVRIEFLKKAVNRKSLTRQSATKKLADELHALDITLKESEEGDV